MYTKYKTKEIVNIVINDVIAQGEIRGVRTLDMVDDNGEEYGMVDYLILPYNSEEMQWVEETTLLEMNIK